MRKPADNQAIKDEAFRLGFAECRVSRVEPLTEDISRFRQWTGHGMHGQMDYLTRNMEKRENPALLVDNARTIVSVAVNYLPETLQNTAYPQIAKYAYGADYHYVVRGMLHKLLSYIREHYGNVSGRAFTDSAPVMERIWAMRSGLGWIGKHSLVVHPRYGSYIFLGELVIDLEVEADQPIAGRCGTCTRCINACPVKAIVAPCVVDARRCLAYLTIEYKGDFDRSTDLHHRLFGCDICQDACPWNRKAQPAKDGQFEPNPAILERTTDDWRRLSVEEFNILASGSSLQRAGYEAIRRNADFCDNRTAENYLPDCTNSVNL